MKCTKSVVFLISGRNYSVISKSCSNILKDALRKCTESRCTFRRNPYLGSTYIPSSDYVTSPFVNKKKEFNGQKLVGFSMEQMYDVVADVENYRCFVPFCKKSNVQSRQPGQLVGYMEVGFPPVVERYTSHLKLVKPTLVKAECRDGILFDYLSTTWNFRPGLKDTPQSCVIDFHVSFEFKSLLYSQLAHLFFNELVRQMESAFITEAERRYGKPSINTVSIKVKPNYLKSNS